jgi:hypothetical protein
MVEAGMIDKLNFIKEHLLYDKNTGIFYWNVDRKKVKKGDIAGGLSSEGYIQIRILGKKMTAHRMAWLLHYGTLPKNNIDHINEIKTDNRIENLREATPSENMRNYTNNVKNTSGYKNVVWNKKASKWQVGLRVEGKKKHIGMFAFINDAIIAAQNARQQFHKEFAKG